MLESGLRRHRRLGAFVAAGWLVACATAAVPPPEPRSPEAVFHPLTTSEIESAASLLRLEDRREYSELVFEVAARSVSASTRRQAVIAAGRIGTANARVLLRHALTDADTSVVASAAFMVGHLRDSLAVPQLSAYLEPTVATITPTVAMEAAMALGRIATGSAGQALHRFLSDVEVDDPLLAPVAGEALVAAARMGDTSTEGIARWLNSADPEVRWRAALALTHTDSPAVTRSLVSLLDDPEPTLRSVALRSLDADRTAAAGLPIDDVLDLLTAAASDTAYRVRIAGLRMLGTYVHPRATRVLLERIDVSNPHETIVAIESLTRMGPVSGSDFVPVLRSIASDRAMPDLIRDRAIEAVSSLDPDGASDWVDSFIVDPAWRIRVTAIRIAARRGEAGWPILERLARDPDARVAAAALDATVLSIGPRDPDRLKRLVLEFVQHPDVEIRAAALRGFTLIDDPMTFPVLLDAYDRARYDAEVDAAVAAIDAVADLSNSGSLAPQRAFFTRFPASTDHHVRRKAIQRFGATAEAAWGPELPIETFTIDARYRRFVEDWLAPPPADRRFPIVRFWTDSGTLDAILYGDLAPLTVANFLALVDAGFFDGQEWARVIPGFVVQGGDPRGDTSGGPGYTIRDEVNRARLRAGSLAMVRAGPDTGGSQFFIALTPDPGLDGDYTVFGRVLNGLDVLENVLPGDRIVSVQAIFGE